MIEILYNAPQIADTGLKERLVKVAIKALGKLGGRFDRLDEQWLAHVVPLVIQEFKATRSKEAVMGPVGLMELYRVCNWC